MTISSGDKVARFFDKELSEAEFAGYMRRFMRACMLQYLHSSEPQNYTHDVREGYYWLTEFVDLIDPQDI